MPKVRVYYFQGYDIANDRFLESKSPAKIEVIKRLGYQPNMSKGVDVDESQLDPNGFFKGQVFASDVKSGV